LTSQQMLSGVKQSHCYLNMQTKSGNLLKTISHDKTDQKKGRKFPRGETETTGLVRRRCDQKKSLPPQNKNQPKKRKPDFRNGAHERIEGSGPTRGGR